MRTTTTTKILGVSAITCMALALTACKNDTNINHNSQGVMTAASTQMQVSIEGAEMNHLSDIRWQLVNALDAKGNTIKLLNQNKDNIEMTMTTADEANRVSFSVGCNTLSGHMMFNNGVASVGEIMSTRMMCSDEEMQAEELLSQLISGDSQIEVMMSDKIVLMQTKPTGEKLVWQGEAKPKTASYSDTIFLEVDSRTTACYQELPNGEQCLRVKQLHYDDQGIQTGSGEWTTLTQNINGFKHNPDVVQVIRVKRYLEEAQDVKGKQYVYELDQLISSQMVK